MTFQNEQQRRAIFARLRGARPIARGQAIARSFYQRHPYVTETAIAIPAFAVGGYLTSRLGAARPVTKFFGRFGVRASARAVGRGTKLFRTRVRGRVLAGNILRTAAVEIPAYVLGDYLIRRTILGRRTERQKIEKVGPQLIGGLIGSSGRVQRLFRARLRL